MGKLRYYTNGIKTIKIEEGKPCPEGYRPGRTFKSNPWNRGLTKDSDERILNASVKGVNTRKANGSYDNPWNKGLTKETSEILLTTANKISEAMKGKPAWNRGIPRSEESNRKQSESMKGKPSWNRGLTKETDERVRSTSEKLKGHECFVKDWAVAKQKEHDTRKKNNSFNASKPEEELYLSLCEEYGENDVIRQYRDPRYPYNCDFYIPSEDLFIELHKHWTHGFHPFNPEDEEDIKVLNEWKEKAIDSEYYSQAIYIWTTLDVKKKEIAEQNNLNYKTIY